MPRLTPHHHTTPNARAWAEDFSALGHAYRVQVLLELANGPKTATELGQAVGLLQSTMSYHLRILREHGLVTWTRQGQSLVYRTNDLALQQLKVALRRMQPRR